MEKLLKNSENDIIFYTSDDGQIKIEVKLENENVWLTQSAMAKLFDTTIANVNMHIKNIYEENELEANRTIKESLIVQNEGNRKVERKVKFYNLDLIIAVRLSCKIKSRHAVSYMGK